MKQLVGYTPEGNKVTIVDFVLNSNTGETFAICLYNVGSLLPLHLDSLDQVHYEII